MRSLLVRSALLTLLALLVLATPLAAQTGAGIKGGLMASKFSTTPDISDVLGNLNDLTGGVFVVASPDAPVTGQFEAMLSRRGTELTADAIGLGSLGKIRGTYVDLSAFVRARVGGSERNQFYVFGGPTVGLEVQAEFVAPGVTEDLDSATEDWDFAAVVGAGADINHVVIEGRYHHGLSNLIVGADLFGFQAKHRAVSLLVGFRF
jgi:hypothetical protein